MAAVNPLRNPAFASPAMPLASSPAPSPAVHGGASPERRFEDALRDARQPPPWESTRETAPDSESTRPREPAASAADSRSAEPANAEPGTPEHTARQARLAARQRLRLDAAAADNRLERQTPARHHAAGEVENSRLNTALPRDALARVGGAHSADPAQKAGPDLGQAVSDAEAGRRTPADNLREAADHDPAPETASSTPLQGATPESATGLVPMPAVTATDTRSAEAQTTADSPTAPSVSALRAADPAAHPDSTHSAGVPANLGQDSTSPAGASRLGGPSGKAGQAGNTGHAGQMGHAPGAGWSAILAQMSPVAAQAEALADRTGAIASAASGAGEKPLVAELGGLFATTAVPATSGLTGSEHRSPLASASSPNSVPEPLRDTLEPAVDSPAFAAALGTRIAWMARDGVERAQLDVHPADLGPVSVQLTLDGPQVRVELSSEASVTRQVLEQSLPSLASALREAGFTLAGGGVFQQPQDRPGRDNSARADQPPGGPQPVAGTVAGLQSLAPARRQGLVDLFA
jgi:flagellar hook-length control protein FliK